MSKMIYWEASMGTSRHLNLITAENSIRLDLFWFKSCELLQGRVKSIVST